MAAASRKPPQPLQCEMCAKSEMPPVVRRLLLPLPLLLFGHIGPTDAAAANSRCTVSLSAESVAVGEWTDFRPATGNATAAQLNAAAADASAGFCSFHGLAYAKPPLGTLRFEPPQMADPDWTGRQTFRQNQSGDDDGAIKCVQQALGDDEIIVIGTEDCLYLNVFAPLRGGANESEPPQLWPVVVWLHGGSFSVGWSSSDIGGFDSLVMQNIVAVAVNYRLAAFGFLSVPGANITGNVGLLDQRMALRWVRQHIGAFGGDADRVTLMGWSAGAASVGYQIEMDAAAEATTTDERDDDASSSALLFHRAIMMSGAPTNPWAVQRDDSDCTKHLLHQLNLTDAPLSHLKARLQAAPAEALVIRNMYRNSFAYLGSREYGFVPTVDGRLVRTAPHLMPATAGSSLARRRPLLIGYTLVETATTFEAGYDWYDVRWPPLLNMTAVRRELLLGRLEGVLRAGRDALGTGTELDADGAVQPSPRWLLFLETLRIVVDIRYGIWRYAESYGRIACRPFVYQFSHAGALGGFRGRLESVARGPVHGDDLAYVFWRAAEAANVSAADAAVRAEMVELWANFIRFGTINRGPKETVLEERKCQQYSGDNAVNECSISLLDIRAASGMKEIPMRSCQRGAAYRLWDAVFRCVYAGDCADMEDGYLDGRQSLLAGDEDTVEAALEARCRLFAGDDDGL